MFLPKRPRLWPILAAILSTRTNAADSAKAVSPISVPPTQYWDGIDGKWSSFGIQVGTPAQQIRVLPMTQEGAIYTVVPEGCTSSDPSNCGDSRGSLFLINRTSTWEQQGLYELSLIAEAPLGYSGNGIYGYDTMTLGWPGDNLPSLNSSIIAGIATKDFYLGGLPLNPWAVNFTSLTQSTPSMMTLLKNQSKIPSLTYGYTAGYYNNNPSISGSLVLGGYDKSRFVENNVSFTMGADISRDLLVSIQSIDTGSTKLLSQPIFAFLDSAIPTIWLPVSVCQAFETAFNLTYDAEAELYLVSDTLHTALQQQNPTVTFTLGPQASGESVKIDMPYGAFDLESQAPFSPSGGRYFPLKRANDSSEYTLGRAFFQNAYVVANYEYFNFSVYQAAYPGSDVAEDIVSLPAKFAIVAGAGSSSSLSTGAIAGIAVGSAAIIVIALGLVLWFCVFKKRQQNTKELHELDSTRQREEREKVAQLDGDATVVHETEGTRIEHELYSEHKPLGHELDARNYQGILPVELPVNEVAASEAHSEHSTPFVTPSVTPAPNPTLMTTHFTSPLSQQGYNHGQETKKAAYHEY
ncbi:uncharacterized protein PV09_07012 [Verruconis gallopava]|uniref:Peptidase A1 domain-containing protein n=1 Tax=Verruconis gallopava TaxID=253628 RepID=A0A0D2AQV0_9PEZI|nr:uncharacterized protein PV09_07012 [Verruconis gallopava]KIW01534.1 hypothetical protein PV09_07012 [Verruconis gallopava]